MAESKLPVRRSDVRSSVLGDIGGPGDLTVSTDWFGFERNALDRKRQVVDNDTALLDSRLRQNDAYIALIDGRMRIASKIAELEDLPNVITDEQQQREHVRFQNEQQRTLERTQSLYDYKCALARNDAELERVKEKALRAARNHEAAQRVKDIEIDKWYSEARSRANNATAEYQDTLTDLARPKPAANADGTANHLASALALIDHQIELERQRANQAAVLALLNMRALLQSSS